jgi:hypothetical protein
MRAEDILPDHVDHGLIGGVSVRKGTVAAFLANARLWLDAATTAAERADAERDMLDALPALRALGLFDILDVRDERLRAFIGSH